MGERRPLAGIDAATGRPLRLTRGRPRAFAEWTTLRRWARLPRWERDVSGYLLRLARKDAGLSQKQLADRLGITQQAVSRAERWTSNPTIDLMRRWLTICRVRLELRIESM